MKHIFDVDIAKEYGAYPAILLENFGYWIKKNEADGVNYHDGNYWTFSSRKALSELFPYLSERQIGTAIQKLIDCGLVITGNYNTSSVNRTLWYALTDKGKSILHFEQMQTAKMSNANYKSVSQRDIELALSNDSAYMLRGDIVNTLNYIGEERVEVHSLVDKNKDSTDLKLEDTTTKKENKTKIQNNRKLTKPELDALKTKMIDEYTSNEKLKSAIREYDLMREQTHKPIATEYTMKLVFRNLNRLAPLSDEDKIKVLEQSILKNWQGLFPVKDDGVREMTEAEIADQKILDKIFG